MCVFTRRKRAPVLPPNTALASCISTSRILTTSRVLIRFDDPIIIKCKRSINPSPAQRMMGYSDSYVSVCTRNMHQHQLQLLQVPQKHHPLSHRFCSCWGWAHYMPAKPNTMCSVKNKRCQSGWLIRGPNLRREFLR